MHCRRRAADLHRADERIHRGSRQDCYGESGTLGRLPVRLTLTHEQVAQTPAGWGLRLLLKSASSARRVAHTSLLLRCVRLSGGPALCPEQEVLVFPIDTASPFSEMAATCYHAINPGISSTIQV